MLRRNSVYSYLSDPNSHALDKEKNAKYSAESNMSLHRSNSNLIRITQDDNMYNSRRKNVRQNIGSMANNETVPSLTPLAKSTRVISHIRLLTNNIPPLRPTAPRSTFLPKTTGSMSYQVQHRRSMIRSSLTDTSLVSQKEPLQATCDVRPGRRISSSFLGNSPIQVQRGLPLSPRKMHSNTYSNHIKSHEVRNSDSDDEKTSEAVCSGDYVADTEDATVDDISSSFTSDDCYTDHEHYTSRGCPMRDAQTQTLPMLEAWYERMEKFPFHKVQKRTETCKVQTTMLCAKRSHSDTSLRRTKLLVRPSTSPPKFVAQSTKVLKLTTTTESSVRPHTSPAQFFSTTGAKTSESNRTESCGESTIFASCFGTKSTEVCRKETTICHSLAEMGPDQQLAENDLKVPETIKTILKPLECTNQTRRSTLNRGMALSLAASFLLFLGLLWTGIAVSLATHRIVTQYLHPQPPEGNAFTLFLQRVSHLCNLLAYWVWYQVYY